MLDYMTLLPELYLCLTTLALLVYGVYRLKQANNALIFLGLLVFALTGALVASRYGEVASVMNGMFIADPFASLVKLLILSAAALVLMLSSGWLKEEGGRPFEFVILMLLSTLGMLLMVSAGNLLSFYMALEMSSLALYVLAAFSRDNAKSSEAGLKYFVLGALASGMLLFGMSLVYGFAGSTDFIALAKLFAAGGAVSKGVIVGLVMIMVGLCFKVTAVPFHMWAPDVYEGAPTPVTAFFATAPKVAALALFTRVMVQPFGHLLAEWQQVAVFVSVASMVTGALAAIMQTNIKRLLAYSSIGHAGFMLMGIAAGNVAGVQAVLIYLAVYVFMSAGAFGCVLMMRRQGHYIEDIKSLAGLSQTRPLMAFTLSAFMFSMAGIPPLAGFFGKLYVVLAAVSAGLAWVAVIGVLASVISGYYYIRIVKLMYFDAPEAPFDATSSRLLRAGVAIGGLVTLFFCLLPSPLVLHARAAAEILLK